MLALKQEGTTQKGNIICTQEAKKVTLYAERLQKRRKNRIDRNHSTTQSHISRFLVTLNPKAQVDVIPSAPPLNARATIEARPVEGEIPT